MSPSRLSRCRHSPRRSVRIRPVAKDCSPVGRRDCCRAPRNGSNAGRRPPQSRPGHGSSTTSAPREVCSPVGRPCCCKPRWPMTSRARGPPSPHQEGLTEATRHRDHVRAGRCSAKGDPCWASGGRPQCQPPWNTGPPHGMWRSSRRRLPSRHRRTAPGRPRCHRRKLSRMPRPRRCTRNPAGCASTGRSRHSQARCPRRMPPKAGACHRHTGLPATTATRKSKTPSLAIATAGGQATMCRWALSARPCISRPRGGTPGR
mmetsp:Transcript_16610/g.51966  ORF Transcript_16610/g.51966 Transcript_16610/m.51966 type:complete len:260 (-) Transcript_16610:391-1170(-)